MTTDKERSSFKSFKEFVKAAWAATINERLRFFTFNFLYVISNLINLAIPWAIGYILAALVKEGYTEAAYKQAMTGIIVYLGLRLANAICHHTARYLQNTVAYNARMNVLTQLFETVLTFPLNWHVRHHSGETLSKVNRSVGAIENTIGTYVWQIVEGVVKIVGTSSLIIYLDPLVALNVFVLSFLSISFMIFFNKRLVKRIRRNYSFYDTINRICVDYLFNIVTVKTLNLERAAGDYLRKHRDDGLYLSKKISKYRELQWGSTGGLGYSLVIATSLAIYFHTNRAIGVFDVQAVYVLLNYLDQIYQAIGSFTGYYSALVEASTSYEDASKILQEASEMKKLQTSFNFNPTWNSLKIEHLSFKYGKEDKTVLRSIGFEVKRGEKIAIVGPSGGGKSTFLKIMGGLLLPEDYKISSDVQENVYIGDIAKVSLLLPQEPEIFSESVTYNLTMGEHYTPEQIKYFTELCHVDRVIQKLPLGFDNNLAEKGLNLSVGEKQRLAMTRGLLKVSHKDILLLDEPTSSLDPKTEKEIFIGVIKHFTDRTIITACHRLALVPLFDKIIYVRHGIIEEVGSFDELIAKRGSFYLAWDDFEKRVVKDHTYDGSQQII